MVIKRPYIAVSIIIAVSFFSGILMYFGSDSALDEGISEEQHPVVQELDELSLEYAQAYADGQYERALSLAEQAVVLAETHSEFDTIYLANTYGNLADIHFTFERFSQAEDFYTRAIDLVRNRNEYRASHYAYWLNNIGLLYEKIEQFDKAASNCSIFS